LLQAPEGNKELLFPSRAEDSRKKRDHRLVGLRGGLVDPRFVNHQL